MQEKDKAGLIEASSYVLAFVALALVLQRTLLAALFSGLVVYSVVHFITPLLGRKISSERARLVAVATLAIFTVSLLTVAIWAVVAFFRSDAGNTQVMLQRMADMLDSSRNQLPEWLSAYVPADVGSLKEMLSNWLRGHALEAKDVGEVALRTAAHVFIGMIIGAMVALSKTRKEISRLPLAAALSRRVENLSDSFERIVFAQIRIAGLNTIFTGTYILVVLPLCGVHLPLAKSLVAITFFAGLLPIIGNLMSNSILVVVALSVSFHSAVASLVFLIVIHKLEYFLNAKIIGSRIQSRAWELLVAMLVMESMCGLPGVVAAPVFYAYLKCELIQRKLI
ncbi:MAG: AI-2E family transporter [Burkholderiaceae bacterium]|nr:AI-2E family transporter [Burkholderiaceae bacterium]